MNPVVDRWYADTSALAKLVLAEPESAALGAWIVGRQLVAADLVRTELLRAVRRVAPDREPAARTLLGAMRMIAMGADVFDAAGKLDPVELRSLDALHLCTALELGDDLAGMVTYDARLAEAAAGHGIDVAVPS